jgi:hypothetical protein
MVASIDATRHRHIMILPDLLWLCTAAYALHVVEEYQLNWRDWARAVIKLPVEWPDFYIVNALAIVLGIVAANIVRQPALALAYPAVMLINATFFHVLPMLLTRGRYSPGVFTAVVLFYPLGIACFYRALSVGLVGWRGVALAFVIGALLMASPVVLLKLKSKPYFRQT